MKRLIAILILAAMLITVSACKRTSELDAKGVNAISDNEAGKQQDDTQNTDVQESADNSLNPVDNSDEKTEANPTDNDKAANDAAPGQIDNSNDYEGKIVSSKHSLYIDYSLEEMESRSAVIMICRYDGNEIQVEPDDTAPDIYANGVFTDRYVTPLKVLKGSVAESVPVRTVGGEVGNVVYAGDEVVLEKGRSYLLYLKEGTPIRRDDVKHYKMFSGGTQGCIPILDDGSLDTTYVDADDIDEITRLYESVK